MIIRFTPDAGAELTEDREWYAHQHQDLDFESFLPRESKRPSIWLVVGFESAQTCNFSLYLKHSLRKGNS